MVDHLGDGSFQEFLSLTNTLIEIQVERPYLGFPAEREQPLDQISAVSARQKYFSQVIS